MANLLVVDDEEDLLTPLIFALEREGHACTVCTTGAQAVEARRTARGTSWCSI